MFRRVGVVFSLMITCSLSGLWGQLCSAEEVLDSAQVINLERHLERFKETSSWMEKAGFTNVQRWIGVDGYQPADGLFEGLNISRGSPGERGCTASHLLLWKAFAESEDEKGVLFIAEDDMLPHSQFKELFPLYWDETPEDFDIVLVGNEFNRKILKEHPLWANRLVLPCWGLCLHAYIVSKKGAAKLYRLYSQSTKSFQAIDHFTVQMIHYHRVIGYCYNGTMFPEKLAPYKHMIYHPLDTGICFQNNQMASTILSRGDSPKEADDE